MQLLLIDNYDSFTYNLVDYFHRLGATCQVWRNDAFTQVQNLPAADALVLSPGPGRPEDAGLLMPSLAHFADKLPILGVCLGHQAIGLHYGAKLQRAKLPMHGKTSPISHAQRDIFSNLPQACPMMRYHSLILEDLPPSLQPLAYSETQEIMALRHVDLPIWGLQFHPESIGSPFGLQLLENWLKLL